MTLTKTQELKYLLTYFADLLGGSDFEKVANVGSIIPPVLYVSIIDTNVRRGDRLGVGRSWLGIGRSWLGIGRSWLGIGRSWLGVGRSWLAGAGWAAGALSSPSLLETFKSKTSPDGMGICTWECIDHLTVQIASFVRGGIE